jgi:uncharacterized membrane protein YtjA (UPF0391 family)
MIRYCFIFLLIALIAGFVGTTGAAGAPGVIARFCFVIASILVGVSLLVGLAQRGDSSALHNRRHSGLRLS